MSRIMTAIMLATSVFSVLLPTIAHAASSATTSVSSATVGTAITPTFTYILDTNATAGQVWADSDTLSFTLSNQFPIWDSLTYTVEFDIDNVDNGGSAETALIAGSTAGTFADDNARTLTVKWDQTTWADVTGSVIRVNVTAGMVPQYFAVSAKASLATATVAAGDAVFATDLAVPVSSAAAAATLSLGANAAVGAVGNLTATLTTPLALANGSTITFTAPGNLDVSLIALGSETFDGSFSGCTVVGQDVTCTASGANTAATGNIVMSGVKSWFAATSQTTNIIVKDASANIQANTMGLSVTDSTVGALTSAGVSFQTNVGENTGTATISLTSTVTSTLSIPNNGKILVTFPAGYVLTGANGATGSSLSGANGTWTSSLSGQVLTLTQSGGATSTAGSVSITIPSIKNPPATGSTGTFAVATQTSAGAAVQSGTAATVSVVNINFNNQPTPIVVPESTPIVVVPAPAATTPVVAPITAPIPVTVPSLGAPSTFSVSADALKALLTGKFESKSAQQASPTIAVDLQIATPASSVVAACAAGSLIKTQGSSAVYYCGADGKRYVFPSSLIYKSWYTDFSDVKTVSTDQLASLQVGGNVKYRPGVTMIKLQTDPRVYVVAPGGMLRWVSSEGVATRLFGAQWNKQVQDVSDAFISSYSMGVSLSE